MSLINALGNTATEDTAQDGNGLLRRIVALLSLNNEMVGAVQRGDVDEIARRDALIAETQQTIDTLKGV